MARVVFLHPDLGIGGAERLVVDGALALQTKGHQVQKALGTGCGGQSGGSGSVESVSFPWTRIRIKKWLDPESGSGSVSNDTNPDPSKTIENIK